MEELNKEKEREKNGRIGQKKNKKGSVMRRDLSFLFTINRSECFVVKEFNY